MADMHKHSVFLTLADASACTNFDAGGSEDEEEVSPLTHSEYCTSEYQAERSADVTQQR